MTRCRLAVGLCAVLVLAGFATDKLLSVQSGGAPPPPASTEWSGTDNSNVVLSTTTTTNDTIQANNSGGYAGGRSNGAGYTGAVYVEFNIIAYGANYTSFGFCNSSSDLTAKLCGQQDAYGLTNNHNTAFMTWNSGSNQIGVYSPNPGAGTLVACAFKITTNHLFCRTSTNSGSTWTDWNFDVASDPGTDTNPAVITPNTPTGPFFLYFEDYGETTSKVQLICSGAAYTARIPTGYSAC